MQMIHPYIKLIFIFLISIIPERINCNIWDNLISQLNSPQFSIPNEIKLELYNHDNKAMEIFISSNFNLIKFSLINEDLVKSVMPNNVTSTVADIYLNFTNGTIKMDFDDSCYYRNISALSKFTTKFILFSYDLLTFFHETTDFYEYVYTNPLKQAVDTKSKLNFRLKNSQSTEDKSNAINVQESSSNKIDMLNNILNNKNIFEKDSMIVFKVNKKTSSLQSLSLKYKNVDLTNLDVKVYNIEQFEQNIFKINHECILLEDKDVDDVNMMSGNKTEKFLSYLE